MFYLIVEGPPTLIVAVLGLCLALVWFVLSVYVYFIAFSLLVPNYKDIGHVP